VKHGPATIKRWTPKFREFEAWIAPTPWHLATKKQVIAWQDDLLKRISPRTVRDVHFAANKALYRWLEEREWCQNPFRDVRIRMPRYEEELREKALSEAEALVILRAALGPLSPRLSPTYRGAFRWVPWICAYTGARVNEITQLRKQDIRMVEGTWAFRVTPEAGRVKTGGARDVPIPTHLVEWGFWSSSRSIPPDRCFTTRRGRGALRLPIRLIRKLAGASPHGSARSGGRS
jgi:integrase